MQSKIRKENYRPAPVIYNFTFLLKLKQKVYLIKGWRWSPGMGFGEPKLKFLDAGLARPVWEGVLSSGLQGRTSLHFYSLSAMIFKTGTRHMIQCTMGNPLYKAGGIDIVLKLYHFLFPLHSFLINI